jgi:hypothetical protein
MIIYLDIDDVVADWHGSAQQILGRTWQKNVERLPDQEWNRIKEYERFYLLLPLMKGARNLVSYCQAAVRKGQAEDLRFLTAIPRNNDMPWAIQDKIRWADGLFHGIPVFFGPYSHDKWKHCKPGDILIDDRHSNCQEWANAGGLSHVYTNVDDCLVWLEGIMGK